MNFSNRSVENSVAMAVEKLLTVGVNFLTIAVIARTFGPDQFGVFSLLQTLFFVGLHIALFTNEQLMVKLSLENNRSLTTLYKDVALLKVFHALPVYLLTVVLAYYFYDSHVSNLTAIYCLLHIINYEILFFSLSRSLEKGRVILALKAVVIVPFALGKVAVVVFSGNLLLLSIVFVLEGLALSLIAYLNFRKVLPTNEHFECKKNNAKSRFHELYIQTWPIFLSAFIISLYSRIDQLMIKHYMGFEELGYYSAVVKISEASTYIVATLIASLMPRLVRLHQSDRSELELNIVRMLRAVVAVSFCTIVFTYFFNTSIMEVVFGKDFGAAGGVLFVHMLGTLFIYFGIICTQWLVLEGLQVFRFYRVITGLLINILLNIVLIPTYGLLGAAYSTVFSQFCSCILFNALSEKTIPILKLQLRALYLQRKSTNTLP